MKIELTALLIHLHYESKKINSSKAFYTTALCSSLSSSSSCGLYIEFTTCAAIYFAIYWSQGTIGVAVYSLTEVEVSGRRFVLRSSPSCCHCYGCFFEIN